MHATQQIETSYGYTVEYSVSLEFRQIRLEAFGDEYWAIAECNNARVCNEGDGVYREVVGGDVEDFPESFWEELESQMPDLNEIDLDARKAAILSWLQDNSLNTSIVDGRFANDFTLIVSDEAIEDEDAETLSHEEWVERYYWYHDDLGTDDFSTVDVRINA